MKATLSRWRSYLPPLLATVIAITVTLLAYQTYAGQQVIGADLATYVLPGWSWLHGQGAPYSEFFDVKPPLTFAFFIPWMFVFGKSLAGFWLLYLLCLGVFFASFWLVVRKVAHSWLALLIFASFSAVTVGLGLLEDLFFVTEVIGFDAVFLGFLFIARTNPKIWHYFASAFLMGCAGQIKELFILTPLVVFIAALRKSDHRRKAVLWSISGCASAIILTIAVLLFWGLDSFHSYIETLGFKREMFPAPSITEVPNLVGTLIWAVQTQALPGFIFLILVTFVVLIWKKQTRRLIELASWLGLRGLVAILSLLTLAGYLWQGHGFYGHYALSALVPIYLLVALCGSIILRSFNAQGKRSVIFSWILIFVLVAPMPSIVSWDLGRTRSISIVEPIRGVTELESPSALARFENIHGSLSDSECLYVMNGWAAPAQYLYANVQACTRFIVPPLTLSPLLRDELVSTLEKNPPRVMIVDPSLAYEADHSNLSQVNVDEIIKNCYSLSTFDEMTYLSNAKDIAITQRCWIENSKLKPQG